MNKNRYYNLGFYSVLFMQEKKDRKSHKWLEMSVWNSLGGGARYVIYATETGKTLA